MILDSIDALIKYEGLNPRFRSVIDFIRQNDLTSLATGIHEIEGKDVFVNIQQTKPRTRTEARWESHRKMIDIQLLISGDEEEHGWLPLSLMPEAPFDEANDIAFYDYEHQSPMPVEPTYIKLHPGQMAIYFPDDAHKPAICDKSLRKAIFKVKA